MNEKRRADLARRFALDPSAPVETILGDHLAKLRAEGPRGALVLEWYYGSDPPLSLGQMGSRFGLSIERVRQIRDRALLRLAGYRSERLFCFQKRECCCLF